MLSQRVGEGGSWGPCRSQEPSWQHLPWAGIVHTATPEALGLDPHIRAGTCSKWPTSHDFPDRTAPFGHPHPHTHCRGSPGS